MIVALVIGVWATYFRGGGDSESVAASEPDSTSSSTPSGATGTSAPTTTTTRPATAPTTSAPPEAPVYDQPFTIDERDLAAGRLPPSDLRYLVAMHIGVQPTPPFCGLNEDGEFCIADLTYDDTEAVVVVGSGFHYTHLYRLASEDRIWSVVEEYTIPEPGDDDEAEPPVPAWAEAPLRELWSR